jgi:GT2 family glycosyltransferase
MTSQTENKINGRFEGILHGVAVGWARQNSKSDAKPIVEVLCDGYPVAFDRADVFRADLEPVSPEDDRCVGFEVKLPRAALLQGKSFSARLANSEIVLEGLCSFGDVVADADAETKLQTLHGDVRVLGGLTLAGWVHPKEYRSGPVKLRFLEDAKLLEEILVEDPIPVQDGAKVPALARAFRVRLPFHLADGHLHLIQVIDDAGRELKGSPVTVAAWQRGAGEVLRDLADSKGVPRIVSEKLKGLAKVTSRVGGVFPGSAAFEDYEVWAKTLPQPKIAQRVSFPITVIVYGKADVRISLESLKQQKVIHQTLLCRDGLINKSDWPTEGAIVLLRAGDRLARSALIRMAQALETAPVAYSDCVQYVGCKWFPWFKPDWDFDLFLAQSYVFGLLAFRADQASQIEDQEHVYYMTLDAVTAANGNVAHVAEILYHQHFAEDAGAAPVDADRMFTAVRRLPILADRNAEVSQLPKRPWLRQVSWSHASPKVSIIIPTRDRYDLLERAVETVMTVTEYPDLEIIIVDNGSSCPETLNYLAGLKQRGVTVLRDMGPFNYSRLNNLAVGCASGDVICLLNNDVEIIDAHWMHEMVGLLMRQDTGVVGAKLLWDNGMVQHAGVVLGMDGGARHVGNRWMAGDPGYCGRNLVTQTYSAVTAACLMIRRSDYIEVDGLDEDAFPVNFNDVDLCLKIRKLGKSVVWTPHAKLLHHESASRGKDELPEKVARARRELDNLQRRWGDILLNDPAYSYYLNKDGDPFMGLSLLPSLENPVRRVLVTDGI